MIAARTKKPLALLLTPSGSSKNSRSVRPRVHSIKCDQYFAAASFAKTKKCSGDGADGSITGLANQCYRGHAVPSRSFRVIDSLIGLTEQIGGREHATGGQETDTRAHG